MLMSKPKHAKCDLHSVIFGITCKPTVLAGILPILMLAPASERDVISVILTTLPATSSEYGTNLLVIPTPL